MKLNIKLVSALIGLLIAMASVNAQAVVHFDLKGYLDAGSTVTLDGVNALDASGLFVEIAGQVTDTTDLESIPEIGIFGADSGTTFRFFNSGGSAAFTNGTGDEEVFSVDNLYWYQGCGPFAPGSYSCAGVSSAPVFGAQSVGIQYIAPPAIIGNPSEMVHLGQDIICDPLPLGLGGTDCVTVATAAPFDLINGDDQSISLRFSAYDLVSYSVYEVPEPAALLILGLGLAGLGVTRAGRTRRQSLFA